MNTDSIKILLVYLWLISNSVSFVTVTNHYNLVTISFSFTYNLISNYFYNNIFSKKYDYVPCFLYLSTSVFINLLFTLSYDVILIVPKFVYVHYISLMLPYLINTMDALNVYNKISILKTLPNNHQFVMNDTSIKI